MMWLAARVDRNKVGFSGFKTSLKKIAFYPNRIFFFAPKFIAWNIGSDGKKIDDMGTLIHKIPHNK